MPDRTILVAYTDNIEEPSESHTYRVAVRAVSYMDRSHYYMLQKEGSDWFQKRTGITLEMELEDDEHRALRNLIFFRAEMLCAIDRERLSGATSYLCDYKNGTDSYERKALPEEWTTLDGMADNMPPDLMDEWLEATRKLNAGTLPSVPDFFPKAALVTSTLGS